MDLAILFYLLPLILVFLAWFIGSQRERSHYRSIRERETRFSTRPCLSTRTVPLVETVSSSRLVVGSVVVSIDRFKQFLASLRNIFGGEVHAYASLIDRARREAILRMKQQAAGADLYVNLKLETTSISKGGDEQMGTVEVIAYGTAIWYRKSV